MQPRVARINTECTHRMCASHGSTLLRCYCILRTTRVPRVPRELGLIFKYACPKKVWDTTAMKYGPRTQPVFHHRPWIRSTRSRRGKPTCSPGRARRLHSCRPFPSLEQWCNWIRQRHSPYPRQHPIKCQGDNPSHDPLTSWRS